MLGRSARLSHPRASKHRCLRGVRMLESSRPITQSYVREESAQYVERWIFGTQNLLALASKPFFNDGGVDTAKIGVEF